jgi:hypothetical protein
MTRLLTLFVAIVGCGGFLTMANLLFSGCTCQEEKVSSPGRGVDATVPQEPSVRPVEPSKLPLGPQEAPVPSIPSMAKIIVPPKMKAPKKSQTVPQAGSPGTPIVVVPPVITSPRVAPLSPSSDPPVVLQKRPLSVGVLIVDRWIVPRPFGMTDSIFGLTLVVKNTTTTPKKVKVVCSWDDGSLFAETMSQTIPPGETVKMMARGFRRSSEGKETLVCKVVEVS